MCRSVIVKGLEAIVIESFATARRYGVEREVLASLAETFPGLDWERSGSYFFQRVARHGRRRAEEMREAAATVREAGLEPVIATAIAERHAFVASLAERGAFAALDRDAADWRELADAIERATAATGARTRQRRRPGLGDELRRVPVGAADLIGTFIAGLRMRPMPRVKVPHVVEKPAAD